MRLEPLYRIRFSYPEGWAVRLEADWQQLFFITEGRCEGSISGRFRGANFPQRRGPDGPFRPDFRAVIETAGPADPNQEEPDLVVDVAELIWEPIAD
jgi:hypothetical protein